jgi:hypothetical protein
VPTKTRRRSSGGLRGSDHYHYRIAYTDDAGESQLLILRTDDRLEQGSIVETKGRLIRIDAGGPTPFRGVVTPLPGRLI